MNNSATTENQTISKPIYRLRIGLLGATIWGRETEEYTFYCVTFEKRYRDSAGDWHYKSWLRGHERLLHRGKRSDQYSHVRPSPFGFGCPKSY